MKPIWEGIHFKVFQESVQMEGGKPRTFEYVWRIDGTRTLAVNNSNEILLTKEYRHELQDFDWRLPGGKLDYVGEPIISAASRELKEETGVNAREWEYLWSTTPDSTVRFQRHFLKATNIEIGPQELGEGENISIAWFPYLTVKEMALAGQIREEISALSVLRFIHKYSLG